MQQDARHAGCGGRLAVSQGRILCRDCHERIASDLEIVNPRQERETVRQAALRWAGVVDAVTGDLVDAIEAES